MKKSIKFALFLTATIFSTSCTASGSVYNSFIYGSNIDENFEVKAANNKDRIISFSGYEWTVKNKLQPAGPGPNYFSNSQDNVFVDKLGQLHLKITKKNNKWYCGEIQSIKSLGYGKYKFYLASRIDLLPSNVVLGLFTWDYDDAYHNREIDIEFSKWGKNDNINSQFVVQPYEIDSNIKRFDAKLTGSYTTHSFEWQAKKVAFESFYGHYNSLPNNNFLINNWAYDGKDIPISGNEKVAINLWNFKGINPEKEVEIVIKKFEFIPDSKTNSTFMVADKLAK